MVDSPLVFLWKKKRLNVSILGALQTFNWFPEQKQTVVPFLFGGLTGVLGGVSKFVRHTRFCMYMYTYTYIHVDVDVDVNAYIYMVESIYVNVYYIYIRV